MSPRGVTWTNALYTCRVRPLEFTGVHARRLKTVAGGVAVLTGLTLLMYTPSTHTAFTYTATHALSGETTAVGGGGEGLAGEPAPTCTPATHLFFLKTHKCASTTVQNILFRFGYSRNLTFALPQSGNYLGNPSLFQAKMIPQTLLPKSGKLDIFAVHSRLNPVQQRRVLHSDTRWITAVRDPAALYASLFDYYHMQASFGFGLREFSKKSAKELASLPRYGNKLGKNQMLFDLGYSDDLSVADLRRALDELDRRFDIVLIAERMDESLVLLRHLLCWSLHDIVVFTKNARRNEVKTRLDPATLAALRELNSGDVILYEHFLAKHKETVHAFGVQRMRDEVSELRALRDEYYEECGLREVKGKDTSLKFKEYSSLVSAYVANNTDDATCLILSLPELALVDLARKRQLTVVREESGEGGGSEGGSEGGEAEAPPPPPHTLPPSPS